MGSVILLEVVSSDYKFLWIDVSGKGSSFDAHIYNESEFKEGLQNNDIAGFPEPAPLPGSGLATLARGAWTSSSAGALAVIFFGLFFTGEPFFLGMIIIK